MSSWKLGRTRQCYKCPWRVDVDPLDIPNGYSEEAHKALDKTIAEPGQVKPGVNMACHESPIGSEMHCIGWLVNQLGPGNNIGLRFQMLKCKNASEIKLVGEQHEFFEDTLPEAGALL